MFKKNVPIYIFIQCNSEMKFSYYRSLMNSPDGPVKTSFGLNFPRSSEGGLASSLHHSGRHLLSTREDDRNTADTTLHLVREGVPAYQEDLGKGGVNGSLSEDFENTLLEGLRQSMRNSDLDRKDILMGLQSMCPTYLNSTESQR